MRTEVIVALIGIVLIVDVIVVVMLLRRHRARRLSGLTTVTATELGSTPLDPPKRSAAPVLAKVFLSLGISLAAAAGVAAAVTAQSNSADHHADGTVVELVPSGHGSNPRYRARVEFTTATGEHIRFLGSVSTSPPPAELGEHIDVLYDPANPHDATINSYWQVWFLPTLLGIIGAPFLLVGCGFAVAARATHQRASHMF